MTTYVVTGASSGLGKCIKEQLLKRNFVKIYSLYFDIAYKFDGTEYPPYDRSKFSDIRKNVSSNFSHYGLYKTILDISDVGNLNDMAIGDAIDDIADIITELLEVKWRLENNSLEDGLWYFELTFKHHIQQHIINLLNFMNQKNSSS